MSPTNIDVNNWARAIDASTLIAVIIIEESNGFIYSYRKLSSFIKISIYFILTMGEIKDFLLTLLNIYT